MAVSGLEYTQGIQAMPWDDIWSDMPYHKTQVTMTTTTYALCPILSMTTTNTKTPIHHIPTKQNEDKYTA